LKLESGNKNTKDAASHYAADDYFNGLFRNKTGEERMKMGFSMFEFAAKFAVASIIEKHKDQDLSPCQLKKELFLRLYRNDFSEIQKAEILKSIR
jgi:hypothetical protein